MPRRFYPYKTILNALNNYRSIFSFYRTNDIPDSSNANNISIPFPRLCPLISESLTQIVINEFVIPLLAFNEVRFSTSGGDLIGKESNRIWKKIEIKSTGRQAFQYFSLKDLQADRIVWIHFGDYLYGKGNDAILYVFANLKPRLISAMPVSKKISLHRLLSLAETYNQTYAEYSLKFASEKLEVYITKQ